MKNLSERVEKMLNGEKKRREVALAWLAEVEETLLPICKILWGSGNSYVPEVANTVALEKISTNSRKVDTHIYFRYKDFCDSCGCESTGFFDSSNSHGYRYWGKPVENLAGADFWYAIELIMNWVPMVAEEMDEREESREKLLLKLNIAV